MYKHFVKRVIDTVLSALGIILLALPMLVIAIIIKIDSPGPVFFKQKRVGIHKSHFTILKFRSMPTSAPHDTPTHQLQNADAMLSSFQKFIRKSSIDELPQIFCIFVGKMSIIGPRPALWNQYKEKPDYFDLALHSVLIDQTVLPNELVLICDGPLTPELDGVIEKYCLLFPTIIKLFRLEENGGLGRALNFGLTKCSYPIVARADSDDICVSTRFEIQTEYMKQHPDVSVISAYIDEFDEDWTKPFSEKRLPLDHESLMKRAKRRNPFNHMAVMFRRDDIIEAGSYQHVPYAEDYDLWVRTASRGKNSATSIEFSSMLV